MLFTLTDWTSLALLTGWQLGKREASYPLWLASIVRRRGKNTTRRREGVGVVVEKKKKVHELSTKIRVIYLQQ